MDIQKRLKPTRFRTTALNAARVDYMATVESDVTREDVLDPDFWSIVAQTVARGMPEGSCPSHVEIFPDDMSWYMECIVVSCGRSFVVLEELIYKKINVNIDNGIVQESQFSVKYAGPHAKWRVTNKNKELIRDGFGTRDEAEDFLKNHERVVSR